MTDKNKPPVVPAISLTDAIKRFAQNGPAELAETLASEVLKGRERAKKRITAARQEIEDGARPKKDRFRL